MTREGIVSAVLDKQLEGFLESIGELHRVVERGATCGICGIPVTLRNISLVVPMRDQVAYVCSRQICMMRYALGEAVDA